MKVKVKVAQSCLTLCNPMDYTIHGILQARILEWVAFPFSREFSQLRDQTQVSHIAGGFFTSWATREAIHIHIFFLFSYPFPKTHFSLLFSSMSLSPFEAAGFSFQGFSSCFSLLCRYLKPWMIHKVLFCVVSFEKQLSGQLLHCSSAVYVIRVIFDSFIQDPNVRLPWWLRW